MTGEDNGAPSSREGWHTLLTLPLKAFELRYVVNAAPLVTGALLEYGDKSSEGVLILDTTAVWQQAIAYLAAHPEEMQRLGWREWEEMLAGIARQQGFDEVLLTPRSGDRGRDVIAVRRGFGCIRMLGQMKAYTQGHVVTADEVRSMLGVLMDPNATKGLIATTSTFAPNIMDDPTIALATPHRLELLDGAALQALMAKIAVDRKS